MKAWMCDFVTMCLSFLELGVHLPMNRSAASRTPGTTFPTYFCCSDPQYDLNSRQQRETFCGPLGGSTQFFCTQHGDSCVANVSACAGVFRCLNAMRLCSSISCLPLGSFSEHGLPFVAHDLPEFDWRMLVPCWCACFGLGPQVCSIMSQVVRALVYMHETAMICHRDLKVCAKPS